MGVRPVLDGLAADVQKARNEAVEALRSWQAAVEGDSNDEEHEAALMLADCLAHAYSISNHEISTEED